jgi:hypothetical protein
VRAGAESSRTTASVGSLGEQTLFAQRSPYGHPKSEIRSQVWFDRADLTLWSAGTEGEARRLGETQLVQTDVDWGRPGLRRRRVRGRGGSQALIPGPSACRSWGCQSGDRRLPLRDRQPCSAGDRGRFERERSLTVPLGRSRTVPA